MHVAAFFPDAVHRRMHGRFTAWPATGGLLSVLAVEPGLGRCWHGPRLATGDVAKRSGTTVGGLPSWRAGGTRKPAVAVPPETGV
ncbi:hypothetical protein D3C72_1961840 [compost metagenome]